VPFRTSYRRIKGCFYCCVEYWLEKSGMADNIRSHETHFNIGRDPVHNMLVHVRSFSAVSNVFKHRGGPFLRAAHNETMGVDIQSYHEFWPARPSTRAVVDYFGDFPVRGMNDKNLLLFVADNVDDKARKNTVERVLGAGGVDVWHAALDTVGYNATYPWPDDSKRLLHCCCMALRKKRRQQLQQLHDGDATLGCLAPVDSQGAAPKCHEGETLDMWKNNLQRPVTSAMYHRRREPGGGGGGLSRDQDVRYPLSMLHSRFVFSPNGEGEACHREYEALISGAIPLVDVTFRAQRLALLQRLPVVMVSDWRTVTTAWLEKKWREVMSKDYNVNVLYMPFWYDLLLTKIAGFE
jgi:hypothetical protein